ncbi:MAG: hypothetical protein PHY72_00995 [Candidatus Pacebacteria bacterium]|nr:hypothetical protein [Candidatus Paceibacterota bacterium]
MLEWFQINSEEIASWGIVIFAFIGAGPLVLQTVLVWLKKEEKGKSVSVIWFSYMFFLSVITIIYAYNIGSTPIKVNGIVRTLAHIPLILGLWKRKGFSKTEKIVFILLFLFTIFAYFYPKKGIIFLIVSVGMALVTLRQPYEIYRNKSIGLVRVEIIILYIFGNAFWIFYAFASEKGGWVLQAVSLSACVSLFISLVVWIKYRR